eukprot:403366208
MTSADLQQLIEQKKELDFDSSVEQNYSTNKLITRQVNQSTVYKSQKYRQNIANTQINTKLKLNRNRFIANSVLTQSIESLGDFKSEIQKEVPSKNNKVANQSKIQSLLISQATSPKVQQFINFPKNQLPIDKITKMDIIDERTQKQSQTSLKKPQPDLRESITNLQPVKLNSRRSREYRKIEQQQKQHYKQLEKCSTTFSSVHKQLQELNHNVKKGNDTFKQSQNTQKQIQSLNDKIQLLNDELQEIKHHTLSIQQSQKGLLTSVCSPKNVIEYVEQQPMREQKSSNNLIPYIMRQSTNSQSTASISYNMDGQSKVGIRYLSLKDINKCFSEMCHYQGRTEVYFMSQKVNKHVFIGHFQEALIETLEIREEGFMNNVKDGLKYIFKQLQKCCTQVTISLLYFTLLIIKSMKLTEDILQASIKFLIKRDNISKTDYEQVITALVIAWFTFNPNNNILKAIKNMKLSLEEFSKVVVQDILKNERLQKNDNKHDAQLLINWIGGQNQQFRDEKPRKPQLISPLHSPAQIGQQKSSKFMTAIKIPNTQSHSRTPSQNQRYLQSDNRNKQSELNNDFLELCSNNCQDNAILFNDSSMTQNALSFLADDTIRQFSQHSNQKIKSSLYQTSVPQKQYYEKSYNTQRLSNIKEHQGQSIINDMQLSPLENKQEMRQPQILSTSYASNSVNFTNSNQPLKIINQSQLQTHAEQENLKQVEVQQNQFKRCSINSSYGPQNQNSYIQNSQDRCTFGNLTNSQKQFLLNMVESNARK